MHRTVTSRSGDGTTRVVLPVEDCRGCRVQVYSGLATDDPAEPRLWASPEKQVRDGRVAFAVPHSRTPGMQVVVRAPWEGHTGYDTNVVLRYAGHSAGDLVDTEVAATRSRASSCFEGTSADTVVLPVVVRRVQVPGVHGPVAGTLAHRVPVRPSARPGAPTTRLQPWASRKTSYSVRSRSATSGSCGCGSPTCWAR